MSLPASAASLPDGLTRRPATDSDRELLYQLYASTRADEMAVVPWSELEKSVFLRQQFQSQHTYYHQTWPHATYDIVELHGEPIGRIYVDVRPDELGLMEITLLPEHRGKGLGTALIQQVLAQAASQGLGVGLFVEPQNPAQRLYARLGFGFVEDHTMYHYLRRPAPRV
ncbi:GNAT family N-acetyltransferase [Armatimonas sp.]|uniref:GNAT family N-acetyltransferase n=1 Tax=Armatimonas sp. TaxID=1872638 RepID=UPI00286C9886|nr:GNAT family N-acetyltransferase [Armatimonas sp.]